MDIPSSKRLRWLLLFQGFFYLISGIWPIVHVDSFMSITGPKIDVWLVQTVGALLLIFGLGFLIESRKAMISLSVAVMAMGAALALSIVDIYFVANEVIWEVYLLDAAVEIALLLNWAVFIAAPYPKVLWVGGMRVFRLRPIARKSPVAHGPPVV